MWPLALLHVTGDCINECFSLETDVWQFCGSCVICAPLDRYIRRHIDRHSTDVKHLKIFAIIVHA